MVREFRYVPAGFAPAPGRRAAAAALRAAGLALARLARRLRAAERVAPGEPVLEFYAEAGAPEGALYLDGKLVGTVPVTRL